MKLSQVSIKRPVLATVMSLTVLLLGTLSYTFLPVREYPDIDSPIVSVTTIYRGASPQVVETEITEVLEEQLSTIEGVKLITSSSAEQVSNITVEFNLSRNVDEAANDVRDRVSRVRGALPSEVDEPRVAKQDVNAQPIIWLSLNGEGFDLLELSEVAENVLSERVQRIEGVGAVFVGAARRYAMRVWLDPQRLASYGLTVADIERTLRAENTEIPSGRVESQGREFAVRTRGDLTTPEEFSAMVVAHRNGRPVRLGDVADVRLGAENDRTYARFNGVPTVGLGITKQQKESTVNVANRIREALPGLAEQIPPGMNLEMAYDSSTFIEDAIHEVVTTLLIAFGLVVIVIFVFLGSLRATVIPAIAIPVSIIGTLTATYFLGFSINIVTLLGFVLAIGLVVDDAIVMLENIHRHMEMGKSRMQAAIDGANEIGFAIVATTIALVAVFIPVAFLTGRVGRLFNEFGIAVAVAVLLSGFVALTLTPMLCSRWLRRHDYGAASEEELLESGSHPRPGASAPQRAQGGFLHRARVSFDAMFHRLHDRYERDLRFALRHRGWVMLGALVVFVAIGVLFRILPSELVPTEDRGVVFNIVLSPEGSTLDYTDKYVRQAESFYAQIPEVDRMFSAVGLGFGGPGRVTDGFIIALLKHYSERKKSQQQIVRELFPRMISIPGVLAIPINPPSLGGSFGRPVQFVLQAESYDELQRAMGTMMQEASKLGYLLNMDSDLKLNKPQLEVEIDRDRAAAQDISVADIGTTLQTLLGGREVTDFKIGNRQYDVILQVPAHNRATPSVIDELYVRGREGLVQLGTVVNVAERVSPRELNHFNRVRAATLAANLPPGVAIGKAIDDLKRVAKSALPVDIQTDLAGQSREFVESSGSLYFLFLIALVFIYLVLAAQFESFIHPLTILVSVPLAVLGALLSLLIFKMSLNIFSQIGLIMLIGLVTKNAILIVEFANQRVRGMDGRAPMSIIDAVVGAARIRLRPILMTTLSTVFGVLPIAMGLGAGAESRKPMGMCVVGGMLFSMILTLIVVPVLYTLLARVAERRKAEQEEALGEGEPGMLPAETS